MAWEKMRKRRNIKGQFIVRKVGDNSLPRNSLEEAYTHRQDEGG